MTYRSHPSYSNRLNHFIAHHCQGSEFDSCVNSPCPFSGPDGCRHPEHPKHKTFAEILRSAPQDEQGPHAKEGGV